ncbi:MAG: hypothetical protein J6A45_03100 [Lachnospiraceae bacterium]|nr:hypothetical protein [Lachnospiraceae bacterium]MBP3351254.1 hypothetical protein [Lachnospiraceae bacterium]
MRKLKYLFILLTICLIIAYWDAPFENRELKQIDRSCVVYYLLNIDGMKGLGHTVLMLQDEKGNAQIFSYNGMQYSLLECLLGKAGVGKMKVFTLTKAEKDAFLLSGNLQVEDTAECDNFDRMLYRYISREEFEQIQKEVEKYIITGTEYEKLYAIYYNTTVEGKKIAADELNAFLNQEGLLKYQIYTHNCDTVARELIAIIDKEVREFNINEKRLTPTDNYLGLCNIVGETWGYKKIGEDTLIEHFFWK